jgi:hypothetical protein
MVLLSRTLPLRTTPLPILREMVVIRSWPLFTRCFNILCTFFPLDPTLLLPPSIVFSDADVWLSVRLLIDVASRKLAGNEPW